MNVKKIIRNIVYEYIQESKEIKNIKHNIKIKNDEFFKTPVVYAEADVDGIRAGVIKVSRVRVKYGKHSIRPFPGA